MGDAPRVTRCVAIRGMERTAATEAEPLVLLESSEMAPSDGVPGEDSPVLVAEPEPIFMPPGAEAFFEDVEPVNPPQP